MLPQYLSGAKRSAAKAQHLVLQLLGASLALGVVTSAGMVWLVTHGAGLFTHDPEVVARMCAAVPPIAASLVLSPLASCLDAVMVSTKDFRYLLLGSLTSVAALVWAQVALTGSMGLPGVWWGLAACFAVRFVVPMLRIVLGRTLAEKQEALAVV